MKCENCAYHYADCDNNGKPISNACCHYHYNDGCAPCEVDDVYETPDID